MKKYLIIIIAALLIGVLAVPSYGLNRTRREAGVIYNNDDGNQRSQIILTWKYQTGDSLYRTWDGRTWTQISFTPPANGQQVSVVSDVYVPYYANVYYEVRTSSYTSANRTDTGAVDPQFLTIPVYPPLRNAHSELSTNTDFCAACHVTHAALGPKLIKAATTTDLCRTCHGPGAPGSRYSVDDGTIRLANGSVVKSHGGPLVGGPTTPWGRNVTSTHLNEPSTPLPGWGGNFLYSQLNCTSWGCHSPHAYMNGYRLNDGSNGVPVAAWVYNPTGMTRETVYYERFSSSFCNVCHYRYNVGPNFGHTGDNDDSTGYFGTQQWVYKHTANTTNVLTWNGGAAAPTEPVPLEKDNQIFCLSCHYVHGSVATGPQLSNYDKDQNSSYDDYTTALKRMDNMGICQNCHKK